jgi:hypothetical protein
MTTKKRQQRMIHLLALLFIIYNQSRGSSSTDFT